MDLAQDDFVCSAALSVGNPAIVEGKTCLQFIRKIFRILVSVCIPFWSFAFSENQETEPPINTDKRRPWPILIGFLTKNL